MGFDTTITATKTALTSWLFDTDEENQTQRMSSSAKGAVKTGVNTLSFTGKVIAAATALPMAALLTISATLGDNISTITYPNGTVVQEGHPLNFAIYDFLEAHPYLDKSINAAGFICLGIASLLGTKKACNLLGSIVNTPNTAVRFGQIAICALAIATFLPPLTVGSLLPNPAEQISCFFLLLLGAYHTIELIAKGQEYVKQKLD